MPYIAEEKPCTQRPFFTLRKRSIKFFLVVGAFIVFFAANIVATPYELSNDSLFSTCPFQHDDKYDFGSLLNLVKSQLETKLEGAESCSATVNQLNNELTAIRNYYIKLDTGLRSSIAVDVINRTLIELQVKLAGLVPGTQQYSLTLAQIASLESDLTFNEINKLYISEDAKETREFQFRSDMYQHINNVVVAFSAASPRCIEYLGGWQQILPSLMGTAALATGYSFFANQAVLGSILQIASSFIQLFQNREVKEAILSIIKVKNYKVLACTYFSVKHTACEYSRAYELSRDTDDLMRLIEGRYLPLPEGEYEKYFYYLEQKNFFSPVFETVARIGTPTTLGTDLLNEYFVAQRASPNTLPEPPIATASDPERKLWLNEVRRRGISFREVNYSTGVSYTLNEQIKQATDDIVLKKANIISVETEIRRSPSFIDLKHELDARFPDLYERLKDLNGYLQQFLGPVDGSLKLPPETWGSILQIKEIMEALQSFLEVKSDIDMAKMGEYETAIKEAGISLFKVMTKFSVAQVDTQSALLLGSKIDDRLNRALLIVEQAYIKRDILENTPLESSFSQYKRDRAIKFYILQNFRQFTGAGRTFRLEDIETARNSFALGFRDEILAMVAMALDSRSELVPALEGSTAPHLCSLFSDLLKHTSKGKDLLERCRNEFPKLELVRGLDRDRTTIDYDDNCFYSSYARDLDTQKILFDRATQMRKIRGTQIRR